MVHMIHQWYLKADCTDNHQQNNFLSLSRNTIYLNLLIVLKFAWLAKTR